MRISWASRYASSNQMRPDGKHHVNQLGHAMPLQQSGDKIRAASCSSAGPGSAQTGSERDDSASITCVSWAVRYLGHSQTKQSGQRPASCASAGPGSGQAAIRRDDTASIMFISRTRLYSGNNQTNNYVAGITGIGPSLYPEKDARSVVCADHVMLRAISFGVGLYGPSLPLKLNI